MKSCKTCCRSLPNTYVKPDQKCDRFGYTKTAITFVLNKFGCCAHEHDVSTVYSSLIEEGALSIKDGIRAGLLKAAELFEMPVRGIALSGQFLRDLANDIDEISSLECGLKLLVDDFACAAENLI